MARVLVRPLVVVFCLCLIGCASTQLNLNALDLASTVNSLVSKQIVSNLGRTIDNQYAIPSQVDFAAGTVTTQNSVTPSFTDPFNAASTTTTAVARTVAAATSTVSTGTFAATRASQSATISASDQWNQSWTLDPITDGDKLRRLRALYRFAVRGDLQALLCEYNVVEKAPGSGGGSGNQVGSGSVTTADGTTFNVVIGGGNAGQEGAGAKKYVKKGCDARGHKSSGNKQYVNADPAFLTRPSCVICAPPSNPSVKGKEPSEVQLEVNERLVPGWLGYDHNIPDGALYLGSPNGHTLYTMDAEAFSDFTLFVLEATTESAASSSGQSGGKTSGKKALVITGNSLLAPP
ncbi:hypothetical protein [Bradyrhizobium sp. CCGUVB14]|uniref:hypothetical protein n=1 Tax=Bradyrhizobium sp. CCGUVB14 TaxID=2949628 RepID=UPI0020B204B5|nr:hypothetical protein [Bradyrhizobium sp. CCGUVB14]MCP3442005.1 hypothetical protein [Bradyrhizobium sp. CCGUVB14]